MEIKENEALRVLKDHNIKPKSSSHEHQMKKSACQAGLDESSGMPDMSFCMGKEELPKSMSRKSTMNDKLPEFTIDRNEQVRGPSLTNENEDIQGSSNKNSNDNVVVEECHDPRPVSCFNGKNDVGIVKSDNKDGESSSWSMRRRIKRDRADELPSNVDDEVICFGNTNPFETSKHIGKETSSLIPVSQPGKSESI